MTKEPSVFDSLDPELKQRLIKAAKEAAAASPQP